jgi:hypothetical protein
MDPRYRIEIEHTGECWEVRFPQLPGCVGRDYDLLEAIDAARFAQEDYLVKYADAARWGENCA